jgi:hypothetical protein
MGRAARLVTGESKALTIFLLSLSGWTCLGLALQREIAAPMITACAAQEFAAFVGLLGLLKDRRSAPFSRQVAFTPPVCGAAKKPRPGRP